MIREAGKYLTEMLLLVRAASLPGVTLLELEAIAAAYISKNKVKWTFIGHHGYKHNLCLSVNDCLVHGIPDRYVLQEWDLLKIDAGITYKGYIADSAVALVVGGIKKNPDAEKLILTTKWALDTGLQFVGPGRSLYDFGYAVEQYTQDHDCTIIRSLTGHGVGKSLWEPPYIYNRWHPDSRDVQFRPGMVIALEPITAMWSKGYIEKPKINNWNLYTEQGDLGCQWEYTLVITEQGYEILAGVVNPEWK
jgi:methionyl aminopeptidase